ncbi:GMP synthase [Ruminiclostridium hungatei]|uniref:GMP synthase n=1 Tax=Ruminiclostridium hungatei TaxID=48256 RepID=A0A1V4SRK6_RUMHU|nr:type 1 glutamine amidotransferase [Ruminiclostridium hungatei]OPX45921.1 GMP synthase [Ruminiclostridium hungatei]
MRIHYLQHVAFEGPAFISQWCREKGHSLTGTQLYNHEAVPPLNQFDLLLIMGGPMNIYEEEKYPWLKYEKSFIKEAIQNHKAVLGICLGAQLITDVLGGKVTRNPQREIGWFEVDFNSEAKSFEVFEGFPERLTVFHWHGDTFSKLGEGAVSIASSEGCANQAFIYGDRVIGFQFHMECTEAGIVSLMEGCADEMSGGSYVQSKEQIYQRMGCVKADNLLMADFLERLGLLCSGKERAWKKSDISREFAAIKQK